MGMLRMEPERHISATVEENSYRQVISNQVFYELGTRYSVYNVDLSFEMEFPQNEAMR
jgi:hypothetical protein